MPNAFNFNASPFDCLSADEQALVRANVDIAYYPKGAVVLDVGDAPSHLLVIIKGFVSQMDDDEVVATYGPDDCFDGRGLVAGRVSSRFVVEEELVAYQLAHATVNALIARNATFGALLFSDLGQKLTALSQRSDAHEQQSMMLARVDSAHLKTPHIVEASTDIVSVARLFHEQRTTSVLVRGLDPKQAKPLACASPNDACPEPEEANLGLFSSTTLQRAILDGRSLNTLAVGEFASFPLVTVRAGDAMGEALMLLLRRRVHRLVVLNDEDNGVKGILEALDLFSFLSNHSWLIAVRIEHADTLEALEQIGSQITDLVATLQRSGTRIDIMARLVQQLNARLFERAWQMMAPREVLQNTCLFVMGSEGRGEQLLKTDQDNGLILRDGWTPPEDLPALCERFSATLARLGYPECPGRIMVNNPDWRGSVSDFCARVRKWIRTPSEVDLMNLAIFLDAHAVAGDAALLGAVREHLAGLTVDNDAHIARFARAVDAFGNPGSWWTRLLGLGDSGAERMNLKKAGIFPIVHGVRALALQRNLTVTSTAERVRALIAEGTLSQELGLELIESLHLLMGLRLRAGLAELALGRTVTGSVDPKRLSSLERDLLKDTLAVVKRFKTVLYQRLRLDMVS